MSHVLAQSGGLRSKGIFKPSGVPAAPLITVVTVVFNGKQVLEKAIQSVIEQPYSAIEYLVIDGGSTDGTVDLLRRYDDRIDHWVSEPDQGIYDAMNKALKLARGEWVYFLGADDVLLPVFDRVASALVEGAVCYGSVRFAGSGLVYDGPFNRYKIMQQNISHQAIFYPRSVYAAKAYDTRVRVFADYKYNIEVMGSGVPFVHMPEIVCVFNESGQSSHRDDAFLGALPQLIRANLGYRYFLIKLARNAAVKLFKNSPVHRLVRSLLRARNG